MSWSTVRRSLLVAVMALVVSATASFAHARAGQPPLSRTADLLPLAQVEVLELAPIDRAALLAEDEAAKVAGNPGPLRFASPVDLELSPDTAGIWAELPDGGHVWRLRVLAPFATDLSFGFTTFDLVPGATLHVWSEDGGYYQGPYTAADASHDGSFWTPIVPGERAVIELYEPPDAARPSILVLGRIGRGYRDLFRREGDSSAKLSCEVNAACPEGDDWRDEIRSVARISIDGAYLCTGSMIMDVPGSFTPFFLTAHHCGVRSSNASTVVAYWNYESPTCDQEGGGSLADSQSGAIFRAARDDNDLCLLQLEEDPDPSSGVYFSGWDARTTTAPQGSFGAHHPRGEEKRLSLNDDPLTSSPNCADGGTSNTHWVVRDYEAGSTDGGSSGSALFDSGSHLIVGYLTGGAAVCSSPINDCYGKFSVGWDGPSTDSRLRDWLDPSNTGTRTVAGADPAASEALRLVDTAAADSCASGHGNSNGVWEPGETVQLAVELSANGNFTGVAGTLTSQTAGVTVTDPSATWPNLASGGTATSNAPHFTLAIGSGVACGTSVNLQLVVTSNQGGPFTFPISGEVGASLTPDVPQPIADNSTTTSTLAVSQNVSLSDVNVHVQLNHTWVQDLTIKLRSPAGTVVTLLDRPDCSDNDMDVTFDDASTVMLQNHCDGTTPWYSGSAHPTQNLAAFNGESSAGTWTLTVEDQAGGDTGSLVDWGLDTTPALAGVCEICSGGGGGGGGGGGSGDYVYHTAGIAHEPGLAGSNWRSKYSLLNLGGAVAEVSAEYLQVAKVAAETGTLASGELRAWDDVAVDLFGVTGNSSGAIKLSSNQPLVVVARTYNLGPLGTYGQFLPGVTAADGLDFGNTGVISQLVKSNAFRTNIGFVNLGSSSCQVRVTLHAAGGATIGSARNVAMPADGWKQVNDIFGAAGAGNQADAYATVDVLTSGCTVWGYGSVVDNATGDPTTIPMTAAP